MRRVLRWFVNLVCGVCLLLGVACLVAWPASYWFGGDLKLTHIRSYQVELTSPDSPDEVLREYTDINLGVVDGWAGFYYMMPDHDVMFGGIDDVTTEWHWDYQRVDESYEAFFAFMLEVWGRVILDLSPDQDAAFKRSYFSFQVPLWFVMAFFLLPGFMWVIHVRSRRRLHHRRQSGLCLHCGYNLHGVTADVCPECGHPRPMVTVQSGD